MIVDSVNILMFSVEPYCVLVEEDIMENEVFVGIVDFSKIDRRTESW